MLETLEQLDEQLDAVDRFPALDEERGRGPVYFLRQLLLGDVIRPAVPRVHGVHAGGAQEAWEPVSGRLPQRRQVTTQHQLEGAVLALARCVKILVTIVRQSSSIGSETQASRQLPRAIELLRQAEDLLAGEVERKAS